MTGALVLQGVLALLLLGLGRWGWVRSGRLASGWMDPEDRAARESVYRRGSLACLVFGGVLLVATCAGLLGSFRS